MSALEAGPPTDAERLLVTFAGLPADRQEELLAFAEFLAAWHCERPRRPWKSLIGAAATPGYSCSAEDIAEARREMWGNFPREF